MKNLGIVPARGGSKRLPRKNIKLLNGKPLIHYSLQAVVNSGVYDEIILSSDDDEILEIGSKIKGITPEKREAKFATDTSKVIELIKNIADRPGYVEKYDTISLFLPTCPFRTSQHIKEGFDLLEKDDFSVVSISEMKEPVQLTATMDERNIINPNAIINPSPLITGNTRSQDFKTIYRVNGGFYIAWIDKFVKQENFFQGQTKGYVIPQEYMVDIDEPLDFEWAEYLIKNNYLTI